MAQRYGLTVQERAETAPEAPETRQTELDLETNQSRPGFSVVLDRFNKTGITMKEAAKNLQAFRAKVKNERESNEK